MNKYMYLKFTFIAVLLLLGGAAMLYGAGKYFIREIVQDVSIVENALAPSASFDVGSSPPFFEVFNIDGRSVKISNFRDTPIIIMFWATWNAQSADQIKIFDDYFLKNTEKKIVLMMINSQEDKSVVANFIKRGGYTLPILLDENGAVGERFKIQTLPLTYFIDRNGIIKDVVVGGFGEKILVDKAALIIQ